MPNPSAGSFSVAKPHPKGQKTHKNGEGGGEATHDQNPGLATGPSAMVVSMSKMTPAAPPCITPL